MFIFGLDSITYVAMPCCSIISKFVLSHNHVLKLECGERGSWGRIPLNYYIRLHNKSHLKQTCMYEYKPTYYIGACL